MGTWAGRGASVRVGRWAVLSVGLTLLGCSDQGPEDLDSQTSELGRGHGWRGGHGHGHVGHGHRFCGRARSLDRHIEHLIEKAERYVAKGELCKAHELLLKGMDALQDLRKKRHANIAAIDEAYAELSAVASEVAKQAAAQGSQCASASGEGQAPVVNLSSSDNHGLKGSVSFGRPVLSTSLEGTTVYTSIHSEGVVSEESGPVGTPALPTYRRLFAIPEGATPVLVSSRFVSSGPAIRTLLRPVQEEPVDQVADEELDDSVFASPAFTIDRSAYTSTSLMPADPCRIDVVGTVRGINLGQLTCTAAQYTPSSQLLSLAKSVEFELRFDSADADPPFLTARSLSPFEVRPTTLTKVLLNRDSLKDHLRASGPVQIACFGEEYLILVHSTLRDAADRLAAWKRTKGIATKVKEIDGLTKEEMVALVQKEYDTCIVRPSYLLLLGDIDTIDTFTIDSIPSDLPYTLASGGTAGPFGLPQVIAGRIPVVSLAQANVVVDKVIAYEQTPPNDLAFYNNVSFASFFQAKDGAKFAPADRDKRTFVHVSEDMRNTLLDQGYEVERIYTRDTGAGYLDPALYEDGTALPSDLDAASGFAWDGDTQDIIDAFDEGRFLIMHRDHGGRSGWADPSFNTGDIPNLSNGNLTPVVYSINCQSGRFDDAGANNFVERLLRYDGGGAVAVIGDTRNSPSSPNSRLTRGLFDATWPDSIPEYGDDSKVRRIGDIFLYGLEYLASSYGATHKSTQKELKLWHVFGDPTLDMWTRAPRSVLINSFRTLEAYRRPVMAAVDPALVLKVAYPVEGASLTAFTVDTLGTVKPIARGTVQNGEALMTGYFTEIDGSDIDYYSLRFSATVENAPAIRVFPDQSGPR